MGGPAASFYNPQSEAEERETERQRESAGEEPWKNGTRPCDRKHLSLQSLAVVAEETEAVQFVLWRRAAGLAAPPTARLVSGFGARRRSLIDTIRIH